MHKNNRETQFSVFHKSNDCLSVDIRVISEETGFYYLESRYYDPNTGRFINADGQLNNGLLGNNMYAYCGNNPIMYVDPDGHFALLVFLGVVGISALAGAIDGGITAAMSGQDFWKGFAAGAIGGTAGGIIGSFVPGAGALLSRAVSTMTYDVLNEWFQTGSVDVDNIGIYIVDTTMDVAYSTLYLDKVQSIGNLLIGTAVNGVIDGVVDIIETELFLSPQAQQRIREPNKKSMICFNYSY